MTYAIGDPLHIDTHNDLLGRIAAVAALGDIPITLPDEAHLGDTGHVDDHNLIAAALAAIEAAPPGLPKPTATGGVVTTITDPTDGKSYSLHRFDAAGDFVVTEAGIVDMLLEGGGQGGGSEWHPAGQGGAVVMARAWFEPGTYHATIGAGGGGGCKPGDWQTSNPGGAGGATSFGVFVAPGGAQAGATGQGTVSTFDGTSVTYGVNGGAKGTQCGSSGTAGRVLLRY